MSKHTHNTSESSPGSGALSALPKPQLKGYLFGQLCGKGTYGYVFRATKINSPKDVVAVKCILLKTLSKTTRENVIQEISILKQLKHRHIVQMLDFQWDNSFIYMIFEFCPGGELATIMHLKRCFPEEIVQHFLQQIASALQFLRTHNISHMDLKPQNILISGIAFVNLLNELNSFKVWRNVVLKVIDFGFSQHLSDEEIATSYRGSPLYMAPEILVGHEYDARVDLWSIGIILYQCLFGCTPYQFTSTDDIITKFKRNQIHISIPTKPKISANCRDLLKRLLQFDPKVRISFDAFFNHPFLDLEHMPSAESFEKAKSIALEAVKEEQNKNYLTAFHLYRDAVFYLMPLHKWGVPGQFSRGTMQKPLMDAILQYMERAELLQKKCNIKSVDPEMMTQIQDVYNMIDAAREHSENELFEQSIQQYDAAIEKALKILKNSDSSTRTEFFGEINNWMTEYEHAKEKLKPKSPSVEPKNFKTGSLRHSKSEKRNPGDDDDEAGTVQFITSASTNTKPRQVKPKRSKWRNIISVNSDLPKDEFATQESDKCYVQ